MRVFLQTGWGSGRGWADGGSGRVTHGEAEWAERAGRVIATRRNGGYADLIVPAAGGDESVRGAR